MREGRKKKESLRDRSRFPKLGKRKGGDEHVLSAAMKKTAVDAEVRQPGPSR